ncbi:class I SAM-dependent methyltransferase [Micromonospora sp. KC606]|uniref:class I SAM-dependent methyltransferase n=1 Tax=Micromonospora sp. KC606 TaxID=2530379 RepID=UPI001FB643B4|nr:class I SAM-dependent methyltransferase [Micromonospora sp. KC606]
MSTNTPIDWTELAPQLVDAARQDQAWYLTTARELVTPGDRLAVDVGCGAAGMALAIARMMTCGRVVAVDAHSAVLDAARDHIRAEWSDPRVRIEPLRADIPAETAVLRETLGAPADLVWASTAVHHVGDQQAAVTALASLLAPRHLSCQPAGSREVSNLLDWWRKSGSAAMISEVVVRGRSGNTCRPRAGPRTACAPATTAGESGSREVC